MFLISLIFVSTSNDKKTFQFFGYGQEGVQKRCMSGIWEWEKFVYTSETFDANLLESNGVTPTGNRAGWFG